MTLLLCLNHETGFWSLFDGRCPFTENIISTDSSCWSDSLHTKRACLPDNNLARASRGPETHRNNTVTVLLCLFFTLHLCDKKGTVMILCAEHSSVFWFYCQKSLSNFLCRVPICSRLQVLVFTSRTTHSPGKHGNTIFKRF